MSRITLVCWDSHEAEERAKALREGGFTVRVHADRRASPKTLAEDPPDAYLIDLSRSPSQGRELGGWLRRSKSTRSVSLVFVEGDPEKTRKAQELLPDAVFTDWERAAEALARAIAEPPIDPVVPGAMDAYAGSPLPKKLGIRPGSQIALVGAPDGFEKALSALPAGARVVRDLDEAPDVLLLFVRSEAALEEAFPSARDALADGGKLWICWPKKSSGIESDLSQRLVRAFGLACEFVDYKIASIDSTFSGLCFARRDAAKRN